jgi:hypothetical protein
MRFRALFLLCLLLVPVAAAAQKPAGPKYDVATETTLKGVVEEVKEVPNSCLGETGVHVILKTDTGPVEVQIAPVDFLKFMEVTFAKGDQLQIVGSKVTVADSPLVMARSVTRNNNEVVVRDKQGAPVWTWMKKG